MKISCGATGLALACAALTAAGSCSVSALDAGSLDEVGLERAPERGEGTIKDIRDLFPDYEAKPSPDTTEDYRPGIGAKLAELPEVDGADLDGIDDLIEALKLLMEKVRVAEQNPGQWLEGNVVLGADEREYTPSEEELVAAELGERLREKFRVTDPGPVAWALAKAGVGPGGLKYRSFDFRHVDVMGSGRFFYASAPIERVLTVRLPR